MALDMNYLVSKLLSEKDILVRGLAHPSVMNEAINFVEMPEDATPFERGLLSLLNLRDTYKLYTTFGAVGVSAKNMYRLLSLGECILLYPGGVYEVKDLQNSFLELFVEGVEGEGYEVSSCLAKSIRVCSYGC